MVITRRRCAKPVARQAGAPVEDLGAFTHLLHHQSIEPPIDLLVDTHILKERSCSGGAICRALRLRASVPQLALDTAVPTSTCSHGNSSAHHQQHCIPAREGQHAATFIVGPQGYRAGGQVSCDVGVGSVRRELRRYTTSIAPSLPIVVSMERWRLQREASGATHEGFAVQVFIWHGVVVVIIAASVLIYFARVRAWCRCCNLVDFWVRWASVSQEFVRVAIDDYVSSAQRLPPHSGAASPSLGWEFRGRGESRTGLERGRHLDLQRSFNDSARARLVESAIPRRGFRRFD